MRVAVALAGLAVLLALAPGAEAVQDELRLVPEWPSSFDEARREPVRLLPGPPLEDRAYHTATAPGTSEAGEHEFTWTLENPDGTRGPAGPIPLAAGQPARVDVYLSAGPPDGRPVVQTPALADAGAAAELTVEAELTIAGETIPADPITHTIVNTPGDDGVQRYAFSFPHDQVQLDRGEGLSVDVSLHQVDENGTRATQPAWRIHTGAQHPSGISLPVEDRQRGTQAALGLQATDEPSSPDRVQQGAYAALAASVLAAGWALRRGYRQLRDA